MSCILYSKLLEKIKNGSATPGEIAHVNVLSEILGKSNRPLFTPSGKYLGLGAIKAPTLIIQTTYGKSALNIYVKYTKLKKEWNYRLNHYMQENPVWP